MITDVGFRTPRDLEVEEFRIGMSWLPELQSPQITTESENRKEAKEALEGQLEREKARHGLSREEFLDGLGLNRRVPRSSGQS